MKRYLIPVVILIAAMIVITGCGGDTPTTSQKPATTTATISTTTQAPTVAPTTTIVKPTLTTTQPTIAPTTTVPPTTTKKKYGGVVRYIQPTAPSSAIGAVWESPFGNASQNISLEPLLREMVDGTLLPWLCSYEVNSDPANPSYTLHLTKGIKFHDGTDFNAQALKWGIEKLIESKLFASVTYFKSIEVKDDYTLYLPLTEWRNSNLPALAKGQHWVVSPTAFEKYGIDYIRTHMVGTGPFVQTDYKRDVSLSGKRFENYWVKGTPYLDEIQYLFVSDQLTQEALFKSGGAEIYDTLANARVAAKLEAEGYKAYSSMAGAYVLLPDTANKESPWSNLKVREAAEYSLDKDSLAKTLGYGYWQGATQAPSPSAPAYVESIKGRKYDVAKAKALLAEAGYPNGFKTKIYATDSSDRNVLVAIQSYLAKVGIDASLEVVTSAAMVGVQSNGWTNGVLYIALGFEANIIPSMGFNFPPVRTGRYKNVANSPRWEELYRKVATTPTLEQSIMQEVTQDVYDFLMWIPLYWYPNIWITQSYVKDTGLGTRSYPYWDMWEAWLDK